MSAKLELSLEDLIKEKRANAPRKPRGGGRGGGGAGQQRAVTRPVSAPRGSFQGSTRGGPRGGRGRGRGGSFPAGGFRGTQGAGASAAFTGRRGRAAGGTKVMISNLHSGVTTQDVQELYEAFGPLIGRATVHYDSNGVSLGTAMVEYVSASDAANAIATYNGEYFDGVPMQVTLVGGPAPAAPLASRLGGGRTGAALAVRGGRVEPRGARAPAARRGAAAAAAVGGTRGGRGAKAAAARPARPAPVKSEDRDADFEAYLALRDKSDAPAGDAAPAEAAAPAPEAAAPAEAAEAAAPVEAAAPAPEAPADGEVF